MTRSRSGDDIVVNSAGISIVLQSRVPGNAFDRVALKSDQVRFACPAPCSANTSAFCRPVLRSSTTDALAIIRGAYSSTVALCQVSPHTHKTDLWIGRDSSSQKELAMARFDLTDFEWSVIQTLLSDKPCGFARVDERRVLNGIFWRLRTGATDRNELGAARSSSSRQAFRTPLCSSVAFG
jgi:hypothetical protein